jgi:hypothetical protein
MEDVTCPCCGYKSIGSIGEWEICLICYWEDDPIQRDDPDYDGGANEPSLRQAQKNYMEYGACQIDRIKYVRKEGRDDKKDPNWEPLI